jgi:hypothetical protein
LKVLENAADEELLIEAAQRDPAQFAEQSRKAGQQKTPAPSFPVTTQRIIRNRESRMQNLASHGPFATHARNSDSRGGKL